MMTCVIDTDWCAMREDVLRGHQSLTACVSDFEQHADPVLLESELVQARVLTKGDVKDLKGLGRTAGVHAVLLALLTKTNCNQHSMMVAALCVSSNFGHRIISDQLSLSMKMLQK